MALAMKTTFKMKLLLVSLTSPSFVMKWMKCKGNSRSKIYLNLTLGEVITLASHRCRLACDVYAEADSGVFECVPEVASSVDFSSRRECNFRYAFAAC